MSENEQPDEGETSASSPPSLRRPKGDWKGRLLRYLRRRKASPQPTPPTEPSSSRRDGFKYTSELLRDTLREQHDDPEIRGIIMELQSFVVPQANRVLAPFSLTIPDNVQYKFANLNTGFESKRGAQRRIARVAMLDPRLTVTVDPTALRQDAAESGLTLRDTVMEKLAHELAHIAEKNDPELNAARRALVEEDDKVQAVIQEVLAEVLSHEARGSTPPEKGKELRAKAKAAAQRRVDWDELADIKEAASEGLGEYVMTKVMPWAVENGYTDRREWRREKLGGAYEDGLSFVQTLAAHPEIGPDGVRRVMAATIDGDRTQIPTMQEVRYDLDRFTQRAYGVSTPGHTFDGPRLT